MKPILFSFLIRSFVNGGGVGWWSMVFLLSLPASSRYVLTPPSFGSLQTSSAASRQPHRNPGVYGTQTFGKRRRRGRSEQTSSCTSTLLAAENTNDQRPTAGLQSRKEADSRVLCHYDEKRYKYKRSRRTARHVLIRRSSRCLLTLVRPHPRRISRSASPNTTRARGN